MGNDAIELLKKQYKGKNILVVGLGLNGGGVGIIRFLHEIGAHITVTDLKSETELHDSIEKIKDCNVRFSFGSSKLEDFMNTDFIFKGPSVPWNNPEIRAAREKGIPIEMDIALFVSLCPAQIVGVTGTRGKSTTTQMIYSVLEKTGRSIFSGGNIPHTSTLALLKQVNKNDIVVLELSSWALSAFHQKKISPHVAVFTNFYPDHLNYYRSMDDYWYDKSAIFAYQKSEDILIANTDLKTKIESLNPKSHTEYFSIEDFKNQLVYLKGQHNRVNASAALHTAIHFGISPQEASGVIANFKGLTYRQENVGKKDGIIFINDTTSTTPVAASTAINTFKEKPIVIILGGNSKNLPSEELVKDLNNVEKIVLLKGSFTDLIHKELENTYKEKITSVHDNLEDAVKEAYESAKTLNKPAYVLFSPAATSFAQFNNEFHRGDEFNRIVNSIIKG